MFKKSIDLSQSVAAKSLELRLMASSFKFTMKRNQKSCCLKQNGIDRDEIFNVCLCLKLKTSSGVKVLCFMLH